MDYADRRFQIFISSTFRDLAEFRRQAIDVVLDRGHLPIALERFGANNESDLAVIKRAIQQSQVYVLILGHRYGELVPGRTISFTEFEFELAEEAGLLVLPLVLSDDALHQKRQALDPTVEKDLREIENHSKLMEFRRRLSHFRSYWAPGDDFRYLVLKSLDDNLTHCEKPGFVREPEAPTTALLASASHNEFIVDIVEELQGFHKLYKRCLEKAEEKRTLSRFFRQQYLDLILRNQVSLFFESGSTIAYVARELGPEVAGAVTLDETGKPNMQISGNNVLAHLELWLRARVPCTTFPWGPPSEEMFGASYGGIEKIQERDPDYSQSPLDEVAKLEIRRLVSAPYNPASRTPALLLGAVSGLQMGLDHKLRFQNVLDDETVADLEQRIARCFGPHVGSYRNKVFKRFMYETGLPIMIFITGDKVDCEIDVGESHFILDSEFTWEMFCQSNPVAFCVACPQHEVAQYSQEFQRNGFHILAGTESAPVGAFAARNDKFIDSFERLQNRSRVLG